jgi:hypothetical protein
MDVKAEHFQNAVKIMEKEYGQDVAIALATSANDVTSVRMVDGCYLDGAFYVTCGALSNKMQQIGQNPQVGICKDMFQAKGLAKSLGNPKLKENAQIREVLKKVFFKFWDQYVCEDNPNSIILKIQLTEAVVYDNKNKYILDFKKKIAERLDSDV